MRIIKARFEGGKLSIPSSIAHEAGLREGDEVEVGFDDGNVITKPVITIAEFRRQLKGCVETSRINPLEVKKIWKA